MLSAVGQQLPKGPTNEAAEREEKPVNFNATTHGIATESDDIMCFESVKDSIKGIPPKASSDLCPFLWHTGAAQDLADILV